MGRGVVADRRRPGASVRGRLARGERPPPRPRSVPAPRAPCPPRRAARPAPGRHDPAAQDGDRVAVESYLARYPDLGDEALVALIYEEFCLREDADEAPDPAEFEARFPAVARGLRRVLDIHGLVGSGRSSPSVPHPQAPAIPFPEAGQTIAGFRLVEELGRGAFARVFRAEERQLADRPVALKVARAGSREPQTLARLQHTHIVPVHSYRTDPVTGLHLLCMPYFGRVTLARILADPRVRVARSGSDLVEALERLGPSAGPRLARSAGRSALTGRTFARAMAWWGARMAEALGHAHDRGVLHRDVKPSNVLVTDDALPMLLDFNLAREVAVDDPEAPPQGLGGTLDYMAPEHLEALAGGTVDGVDSRSDIYGLGVVLYEALMGVRPFTIPREALSVGEALLTAAETRRAGAPRLRTIRPEVPTALESVVRRCLAPEPSDRYASAADLVIDLQAVADDRSLRFAREPLVTGPTAGSAATVARSRWPSPSSWPRWSSPPPSSSARRRLHRRSEITHLIDEGKRSAQANRFAEAMVQFDAAARLAHQRMEPRACRRTSSSSTKGAGTPRRLRADRGHPRVVPQGSRILPGNGGGRDDRRQRRRPLRRLRPPRSASPAWRRPGDGDPRPANRAPNRSPSPRPTTGPNNERS
ncbi:MAG: serine/threonine-protein kinase [Singulisphaera sp.]